MGVAPIYMVCLEWPQLGHGELSVLCVYAVKGEGGREELSVLCCKQVNAFSSHIGREAACKVLCAPTM